MAYTGTGTQDDPYLVANLTDFLECIGKTGVYVKVVADIDANDDENYNGQIETPIEIRSHLYADSLRIIKNITVYNYNDYFINSFGITSIDNIYFQDCVHKTINDYSSTGYFISHSGNTKVGNSMTLNYVKFSVRVVANKSLSTYYTFDDNVYLDHCAFDIVMVSSKAIFVRDDSTQEKYCNFIYRNFKFSNTDSWHTLFAGPEYSAILLVDCAFNYGRGTGGSFFLASYYTNTKESYFALINPTFDVGTTFYIGKSQNINVLATAFADSPLPTYYFNNEMRKVTPDQLKDEDYLKEIGFLPSGSESVWSFNSDINYGFPYIRDLFEVFEWIEPVTDRTYSDIRNAIKLLEQKKNNPYIEFEFTKGFLNYTDLNRIEGNTQFLAGKLGETGSFKTDWETKNIPLVSEMSRIIQNMKNVKEKFAEKYPEIVIEEIPSRLTDFGDFNKLEYVQMQIYKTLTYDPSKITLVRLDRNLQETGETFEYDSLSDEIRTKLQDGYKYNVYIGEEAGITSIDSVATGASAFYNCPNLISITIPNSVTSINGSAFFGCSGLNSVTIPNGVTSIYPATFYKCTSLTSITIPDSVTTINNSAFYGCSSLTSITIPASVTTILDYAFRNCTNLVNITVEKSADSISGAPWGATNANVIWTG